MSSIPSFSAPESYDPGSEVHDEPLPPEFSPETTVMLDMELTWPDVASGLGRILMGHLVSIFGPLLGMALIFGAVLQGDAVKKFEKAPAEHLIALILGMLIMGGSSLAGYIMILSGYFRCLLNAPDRHGARWLMFACMTCMVIGPVLGFVSGSINNREQMKMLSKQKEITREVALQLLNSPMGYMQVASTVVSLASIVTFVLFLRAIARCFEDEDRAQYAVGYLMFLGLGLSFIVFFGLYGIGDLSLFKVIGGLALWAVLCFVWFLAQIWSARRGILKGLAQFRASKPQDLPATQMFH